VKTYSDAPFYDPLTSKRKFSVHTTCVCCRKHIRWNAIENEFWFCEIRLRKSYSIFVDFVNSSAV